MLHTQLGGHGEEVISSLKYLVRFLSTTSATWILERNRGESPRDEIEPTPFKAIWKVNNGNDIRENPYS